MKSRITTNAHTSDVLTLSIGDRIRVFFGIKVKIGSLVIQSKSCRG
jgi:hypothetical protein